MFAHLLEKAQSRLTEEMALKIFDLSFFPQNALKLFQTASAVRDRILGQELWWTASLEAALFLPSNSHKAAAAPNIRQDILLSALRILENLGFAHLNFLVRDGSGIYAKAISAIVDAVRVASPIHIEVMRVHSISTNIPGPENSQHSTPSPYSRCQSDPGIPKDTPDRSLLELRSGKDIPRYTILLPDAAESAQGLIHRLFDLSRLHGPHRILVSQRPASAMPDQFAKSCSSHWRLARAIAIARMILPQAQIFSDNANPESIPLWIMAGGGNQVVGAAVVREESTPQEGTKATPVAEGISIRNFMSIQKSYAQDMGISIGFYPPPAPWPAPNRRPFVGCPKH